MERGAWHALYLHGFASGPQSRKAGFFSERLKQLGIGVQIPDLTEGDFEHLTIGRQLDVVDSLLRNEKRPAILIGSSLGGYLAALCAARHPESVTACILLAPAFDFHRLWLDRMTPEEHRRWQQEGTVEVFHYGLGRNAPLGYQLLDDARQYEPFPAVTQPTLILHGTKDDLVPITLSEQFVAEHHNACLHSFSSGHELTDVLDPMWSVSESFLQDLRSKDPMLDCG